jgi:hypothetical protein
MQRQKLASGRANMEAAMRRPPRYGEEKFSRWCFVKLEVAQKFTQRFGGEIVPSVIPGSRRLRPACTVPIDKAVCGSDRGGMQGNA